MIELKKIKYLLNTEQYSSSRNENNEQQNHSTV